MKITVSILGWKDLCCGCGKVIPSTEKVCMLSELKGLDGSIHFCEDCVKVISNSKDNHNSRTGTGYPSEL